MKFVAFKGNTRQRRMLVLRIMRWNRTKIQVSRLEFDSKKINKKHYVKISRKANKKAELRKKYREW